MHTKLRFPSVLIQVLENKQDIASQSSDLSAFLSVVEEEKTKNFVLKSCFASVFKCDVVFVSLRKKTLYEFQRILVQYPDIFVLRSEDLRVVTSIVKLRNDLESYFYETLLSFFSYQMYLETDVQKTEYYSRLKSVIFDFDNLFSKLYRRYGDFAFFIVNNLDYCLNYRSVKDKNLFQDVELLFKDIVTYKNLKDSFSTAERCHFLYMNDALNPYFLVYIDAVSQDKFSVEKKRLKEFLKFTQWSSFKSYFENMVMTQHFDLEKVKVMSSRKECLQFFDFFNVERTFQEYLSYRNHNLVNASLLFDDVLGYSLLDELKTISFKLNKDSDVETIIRVPR